MSISNHRKAASALLLSLGLAGLAGCTTPGVPTNRSLESIHQPVVQHTNYTFDVTTGPDGISPAEKRRLAAWFDAMDLHYGDRVAIDDPLGSAATRADVEKVVGRYGMLLADAAPVTPGYVNAGTARVVIIRSSASVKGCPDWGTRSDVTLNNATASGYGCAINGNLAAMIANPEHLVQGASGPSQTTIMSSTKAIDAFRAAAPTGEKGLKANASDGK